MSSHNKPGWKTTEFWLSMLALILAFVIDMDLAIKSATWLKAVTTASAILASLGYGLQRGALKRDNLKAATMDLVSRAAKLSADALEKNAAAEMLKATDALASPPRPAEDVGDISVPPA